ncbi:hypothetical protein C10C_0341 [Chlamydia serpentis]|uniref:Uncharacterized protein n=1 Tax=Chlamydia serpentis TaxID=1967782 RepID=A0A2R8FAR2_9CHLA|nr:hypothetical protein [Chlamydia serpentis]SPN73513.1 hypothetical protein C10C_0341 [Chlamydia serpentis]
MKIGATFSDKTHPEQPFPTSTQTQDTPSRVTPVSKRQKVLEVARSVLNVLVIFLIFAASITLFVLAGLSFPVMQCFMITSIITVVAATLGILALLLHLLPKKEVSSQLPQIILIPSSEETRPKRTRPPYDTSTSSILFCHYEETKHELPPGILIPGASSIDVFTLKNYPSCKVVSACASNLTKISDHESPVHSLFLLPPENSYTKTDQPKPTSQPLKQLQELLGKEEWSKIKSQMDLQKTPGAWQSFPWQGSSKNVILAWSPWGHYDRDVERMLDQQCSSSINYHDLAYEHRKKNMNSELFFKALLKELMQKGITKVHIHGLEFFNPLSHNGKPHFQTHNPYLKSKLLEALALAAKEVSKETKAALTLYVTQDDKNPFHLE